MSTADVDAIAAGIVARLGLAEPEPVPTSELFVDWSTLWHRDRSGSDWVYEPVLARARGHVIFAGHKTGKSLLTLAIVAELATGPEPVVVVYGDWEMSEDDLLDRLEDLGYGPDTDLSRLRYWLLPTLPPLDTAAGGERLDQILDDVAADFPDHHLVVIIDTTSRAVEGPEDKADTMQAWYSHTGIRLKRRGATFARLDHAGKDPTKGQRGSSAKGDDIDLAWSLTRTDDGLELKRALTRINWAPERVAFKMRLDPLRFEQVPQAFLAGTAEVAALLDELEVPVDAGTGIAQKALKEAKQGRRRALVVDALRYRRNGAR